MEEKFLEIISKHMMGKNVIGRSQYGFMKAKSCLTNLIAFNNEMTGLVDEGRAMVIVYLHVSKAFNTVSHKILADELTKYGLDKWTVRWTENCLELPSS